MEASFAVSNHRSGCCEVIVLAGELDMATAPALADVLDGMMVIPDHIVFDVSELTFVDSSGLHLLIRASALTEGRIWLKACSGHLRRLLDIAGISQSFCLDDDLDGAHQACMQRRAG